MALVFRPYLSLVGPNYLFITQPDLVENRKQ